MKLAVILAALLLTLPVSAQTVKVLGRKITPAAACGNGIKETGEACDDPANNGSGDFGTDTCIAHSCGGGTLRCITSCTVISLTSCTSCPAATDSFSDDPFVSRWVKDYGATWAWESGALDVTHPVTYADDIIRYATPTYASGSGGAQCAKLKLVGWNSGSPTPGIYVGFIFRGASTAAGNKYAVLTRPSDGRAIFRSFPANKDGRCTIATGTTCAITADCPGGETCDVAGSEVGVNTSCFAPPVAAGETICARLTGTSTTGGTTTASFWKSGQNNACVGTDYTAWGGASCSIASTAPPIVVDSGQYSGIVIDDSGAANEGTTVDDWSVWDCP